MHIDKPKLTSQDDFIDRNYNQGLGKLRLHLEGDRTMITGGMPYPYEIIYDRPYRRIKVLRSIGTLPDVIAMPSTSVTVTIPPVVHISSQVQSVYYELYNVDTGYTTTSTTNVVSLMTPSEMHGEFIFLVRAISDNDIEGDYATLRIRSEPLGYLSVTSFDDSMPSEVIVDNTDVFTINVQYATALTNHSGIHIRITKTKNVSIVTNNHEIDIGTDIPYTTPSYTGAAYIRFIIEDHSGYESEEQQIDFNVIPNHSPVIDGLEHDIPFHSLLTDPINFRWWGVTDVDGDTLTMVITEIVGGTASRMDGIEANTLVNIQPNNPTSGSVLLRWKLYDGYTYSSIQYHVIHINSQPPMIEDVSVMIENQPSNQILVTPCESYTVVMDGAVDPNERPISIYLHGPSNITFSKDVVAQGEAFVVTVGCNTHSDRGSYFSGTFTNGVSSNTRVTTLRTNPQHGHTRLATPTVYNKPAGVTQIVIIAGGGIGEDTEFIGGGVHITFPGVAASSTILPETQERLLIDLPPEATTFVVTPALNTAVNITW